MAAAQKRATRSPASNAATWRDVTPAAVVLVSGPEEYLGIRAMDRIRAQVRAAAPDVEVSRSRASRTLCDAARRRVTADLSAGEGCSAVTVTGETSKTSRVSGTRVAT